MALFSKSFAFLSIFYQNSLILIRQDAKTNVFSTYVHKIIGEEFEDSRSEQEARDILFKVHFQIELRLASRKV